MSAADPSRRTDAHASRRCGAAAVILSVALLTAACRTDGGPARGPTPSPPTVTGEDRASPPRSGVAVGVVLGPEGDNGLYADDVRDAVAGLPERRDINVIRTRVLEPPDEDFRRDELAFLADEGVSLVCTVGREGVAAVLELAPRYPTTTFCVLGATAVDAPDNVVSVAWRDEELAFLAGAAASAAAGEPDADGAPGAEPAAGAPAIGLVAVGDASVTDAERLRTAFDAGAQHVRPGIRIRPEGLPGVSGDEVEEAARTAAERLFEFDQGPARVVVPFGGASVTRGVRGAAAASDGLVVGLGGDAAVLDGETGRDVVVASIMPRYDVALAEIVRTLAEPSDTPLVLGAADDAVRAAAGETETTATVVATIRDLLRSIARGAVDVPDSDTRREEGR